MRLLFLGDVVGRPGRRALTALLPRLIAREAVGVVTVIGRGFMGPADCPFAAVDGAVNEMRRETAIIVVDMHGEATSEKVAMGRFLDGRVSAVVGSHTHVQTADDDILPGGTA